MNEFAVTGRLMAIWRHSQDEGHEAVSRKWIVNCCLFDVRRKNLKDAFIGALTTHRFLEKIGDDAYRIKGNAKHIANLVAYKKKTKPARDAKAKKSLNDEIDQKSVHQTELTDTKFVALDETQEVIHIDDGKALPVAKVDEKNKQELFEKNSVNRAVDSTVDSLQEQVLCANESESEKTFYKKSPEEREKHNGVDSRYKGNSLSHSEFLIILKIWDSERGLMIPALNSDKMCQMLMKTRWEQNPSEEFWRGVVSKMASSHFLTGSKGFKATLEWTLRPGNLEKVLSGVYDNAPIPGQELHPDTLAMIARVTANEQAEAAAIAQKKLDQDRRNLEKQNKTQSGGLMKAGSLMGEVMNKIGEQARRTR
jgi:hypothetical protein